MTWFAIWLLSVFVVVALSIGCALWSLLQPHRLRLKQPNTKKKVFELACSGWLGRTMNANHWGAFTLVLPFCAVIFYWIGENTPKVHLQTRIHEFQHVKQDEANWCFLISWVKYLCETVRKRLQYGNWMDAYEFNKYEAEAYAVEHAVADRKDPMPEWAAE